jgi:3-phenylpropionate/trans-cinnamate dioxygenase ferredoxin subunit
MAAFVKVAEVSEVPPGRVKVAVVGNQRIAVCNVGGTFYAIDDQCTHDYGPLDQGELEDHVIECPRHGARFDVRTGAALSMPAVVPVKTYPVRVEGNAVLVAVEE